MFLEKLSYGFNDFVLPLLSEFCPPNKSHLLTLLVLNTLAYQTQAGGNLAACIRKAYKMLCREFSLSNAPAREPLSCLKRLLVRF